MDDDLELLRRVCATKDFIRRALLDDDLPDWGLAKDYGQFLIRLGHDDLLAHLLVGRASRHTGDLTTAGAELGKCRSLINDRGASHDSEIEPLLPAIAAEEALLGGDARS
jgi:hypothetical protein